MTASTAERELTDIVLAGAGGHARACIDVIEHEARYRVRGLLGIAAEVGTEVLGYPVLGMDTELGKFVSEGSYALVTVGQIKQPEIRIRLYDAIVAAGGRCATVVSPRAIVSRHAELGDGTIVLHGAVVNAAARVGRNCIVNTLALVEHDAVVGDHCHVATGARLNSGVRVGRGTFIGSGATVKQGVRIGERCLIAMGARVTRDCPDGKLVT